MRAAWILIGAALVLANGCAQQDWIDRTLVTVDVTGVWQGQQSGSNYVNDIELVVRQEGAKVTGEMKFLWGSPIPIEGTVSGDKFSFHSVSRTSMNVELQVNGDEMTGAGGRLTPFRITLRRRQ